MPEAVLVRRTGAREVATLPEPLPEALTVDGVQYVYNRHADRPEGRPSYVEAPGAPPLVRPCLHGCPGCGAVEACGASPCPVGIGRPRRCADCSA